MHFGRHIFSTSMVCLVWVRSIFVAMQCCVLQFAIAHEYLFLFVVLFAVALRSLLAPPLPVKNNARSKIDGISYQNLGRRRILRDADAGRPPKTFRLQTHFSTCRQPLFSEPLS